MELNLPVALGILVAVIALGIGGLVGGNMMTLETTLTMVLPSMVAFAAFVFAIGVKHGEYRAGTR